MPDSRSIWERNMADLNIKIGSLTLKNPVMVASGTYGYGEEFSELYDISRLGALVTKGISLKPRLGNAMPRVAETSSGMLNAIGLANVGIEIFLEEKLSFLQSKNATVVVNIFGENIEEYVELAKILDGAGGVHALELNISCPNVSRGGMHFGSDPSVVSDLVESVRHVTDLPVIVKLSPMVSDITQIALAAERSGADAVSLINTIPAMAIDVKSRRPKLANVSGGLSGPAIKPVAIRQVWLTFKAVKIPVIGMGGIMSCEDVVEFFIAGASAVQIGTANFVKPNIALEIIDGLEDKMRALGFKNISEAVGSLEI